MKVRVSANSPSLWPTMFSVTYTGMCCLPLCTAIVSPMKSGVTVERLADVGPALQAAVRAQADGTCTVLEMMVTQELGDPFRRDALSKPVRYLEKYKDFT